MPRSRPDRPLSGIAASASRVAHVYRRSKPTDPAHGLAGQGALSDTDRNEFKERGRHLLSLLLDHLEGGDRERSGARLAEAVAAAREYGRLAASSGIALPDTVEAFVRFRGAFTGELAAVARRRRLATREATSLFVEADSAVDRLLIALMSGHAEGRS